MGVGGCYQRSWIERHRRGDSSEEAHPAREVVARVEEAADAAMKISATRKNHCSKETHDWQADSEGAPERRDPPPVFSDVADKLAHLRACVILRRERDDLRSEIAAAGRDGWGEFHKKSMSFATPSVEFMIADHHQQTALTPPKVLGATHGWSWRK